MRKCSESKYSKGGEESWTKSAWRWRRSESREDLPKEVARAEIGCLTRSLRGF